MRAHDIPDERVDRGIQVVLEPPIVRVEYEVSLSDWTLYQDLKRLAPELAPGERFDRIERYARMIAPLNARGLLATVDGRELAWAVGEPEVDYEEHPLLTFHLRAEIPAEGRLHVRDTNFSSSYGISRLALRASVGTAVEGYDGPDELEEVEEIPLFLLSDDEERQTREVSVVYRSEAMGEPPSSAQSLAETPGEVGPDPVVRDGPGGERPARSAPRGLNALFWDASDRSLPLFLLAAFVLGAAHAVQPGHGKSVVVGASIQGPRPLRRGLLLAGSAAASHLTIAVALAVVVVWIVPSGFDRIDAALTRAVGLLLAIIGAWRIGTTLRGQTAAEVTAETEAAPGVPVRSSRDAVASGLAIGAIPCWDAVLLLAIAWVSGRLVLGVSLMIAFSLGAAATLLGVALAAGLFRSLASRALRSGRLERGLNAVGGVLLGGIGVFLFLA